MVFLRQRGLETDLKIFDVLRWSIVGCFTLKDRREIPDLNIPQRIFSGFTKSINMSIYIECYDTYAFQMSHLLS